MKIDLGCGRNKQPGMVGIDCDPTSDADLIVNLDREGLPLPDDSCEAIFSNHAMEHFTRTHFVLCEIWRVGQPGAEVTLRVPFVQAQAQHDPAHAQPFSEYWVRRCYWFRQHFGDLRLQFEYDPDLLAWARQALPGADDDVLRTLFWNVCLHMTVRCTVRKPADDLEETRALVEGESWWRQ
jgi:SAM-dependent methyltransferase